MSGFDCIVCGEICIDLPVGPISRTRPLAEQEFARIQPIEPGGGGIVANSAAALARLEQRVAAFACLGRDAWAKILKARLGREGVATEYLFELPGETTSVTAVLIGEDGEHSFAYSGQASHRLSKQTVLTNLAAFAESKFALFGYYGLDAPFELELAEMLAAIQDTGCRTALDAAGGGGSLQPLDEILPHLDIYFPSYGEAAKQTGEEDPEAMLSLFRNYAPTALLGIKLGSQGAVFSLQPDDYIRVSPIEPPGPIVDTTGAGDCFYAGLIAGLCRGLEPSEAARVGAAAGACSVTGVGAVQGLRDFAATLSLAQR